MQVRLLQPEKLKLALFSKCSVVWLWCGCGAHQPVAPNQSDGQDGTDANSFAFAFNIRLLWSKAKVVSNYREVGGRSARHCKNGFITAKASYSIVICIENNATRVLSLFSLCGIFISPYPMSVLSVLALA
jgi:hypothetical protein